MRRLTITLVLALSVIGSLVLTTTGGARPFDPPGESVVLVDAGPCPSTPAPKLVVPGGVYRALADELRQQGYSRAQIKAESGDALVTPATGSRAASADCDRTR